MKKASSRSQRGSKGIKVKHILQICVLLGVCIWLIYQVKYSHDKKKEFYEKDGKKLSESEDGLVKLGRKDLLPVYHNNQAEEDEDEEEVTRGEEETESKSNVENGHHEEEDEEDKNKQGDEVVEEDEDESKHEEDDIDEQDQSKFAQDNELLEEENESGLNERDKKENETNSADEVDEGREEHYKADDASSAVSHESRILNAEDNPNATISEVETQKELIMKLGEPKSSDFVDKTATKAKDGDTESSSSETKSLVTESKGDTFSGNSTEAVLEASRFVQNETEIMRNRSQEHDKTEDGADLQTVFKLEQDRNESDPNITVSTNITNKDSIQDESRNSTSESFPIEKISGSNTTEVKEHHGSEGDDESGEKESSNLSKEEREALTDPQTLQIEGNEEDEEEANRAE